MAQVFSYPVADLPRVSRREVARGNAVARWVAAWPGGGTRLAAFAGGELAARVRAGGAVMRGAARAIVMIDGARLEVSAPGGVARRLAQRMIGGPAELDASRPLDATEEALWAVVVAAAVVDLGIAAEVWPAIDGGDDAELADADGFELAITGALTATVVIRAPRSLALRVPAPRPLAAWTGRTALAPLIVLGRCAIPRAALGQLAPRDVITLEPPVGGRLELVLGEGAIGLRAAPGAVEAEVATGYVVRDMALPDEAHLELTVALGTTRVTLRELTELVIGQVVPLGRPLAGPFELRAEGRVLGRGELVDVDGELGVRIVSLGE